MNFKALVAQSKFVIHSFIVPLNLRIENLSNNKVYVFLKIQQTLLDLTLLKNI